MNERRGVNAQDQPRRRTGGLLLSLLFILSLLMSLCCMLLFAQLALSGEKQEWLKASMASNLRADYSPDEWAEMRRFAPLQPGVIEQTARDEDALSATPTTRLVPVAVAVVAITSTPFPSPSPTSVPVAMPQPSSTPQPSPTLQPTATDTPLPTSPVTPSPTAPPTPTPTSPPPTPTSPPPTPTSPPPTPTSPPPPPTPTSPPPTPTPTSPAAPTPTHTATPTPTPTTTDTPTPTPTITDTPTPTPTTTDTPTPTNTPTPTPIPPPSVFSITPNQEENAALVPVVIQGANFFGVPTATLGSGILITISAATADTLTGTVPAGLTPGVYALTVTNPDSQFDTLSPAYTALNPPSPDTTLETGYVVTFGSGASGALGDDDQVQVIFFDVPASYTGGLYFRIFDADTGADVDEPNVAWNTTITYTLRGGSGAYSLPNARSSHPDSTGINSGTLLTQTVIGNDGAYNNNWNLVFGPYSPGDGEEPVVGSSRRVFKLVVEGASGDDGNFYNVALSTAPLTNTAPAGSRVFAYSWTFWLTSDAAQRPPLYPYVPAGTSSFEQHNWDMDYASGTMTLHTPLRDIVVPGSSISGNNESRTSSHPVQVGEDGTTWTVTMEFTDSVSPNNDITFWVTRDSGTEDLAIFTRPTTDPPP